MYLLDTNICIYIIKRKPLSVIERLRALSLDEVAVSAITQAELEFGVQKSARPEQNQEALRGFLSPLKILPFDDRAACHYGEIRSQLEKSGQVIGAIDLLIAAHARSLSCRLVTNNEREFARVPGLLVENWV